jgi:hypothetical protein
MLDSERLSLCLKDLTPETIIPLPHTVGCERWDCCAHCPGPPDWRVNVGPDASAVFLRFQNLPPGARKNLVVRGDAKWQKDGQLRLGPGETRISGLRSDRSGRWPVAFMSVAVSKEKLDRAAAAPEAQQQLSPPREREATLRIRQPQPIAVAIEQFSGKAMVGAGNVSIFPGACPSGGGGGPGSAAAIAVVNARAASVTFYALPVDPNLGNGVAPNREIRGAHTGIGAPSASAVAVDGAGQIYVFNGYSPDQTASVTVYDRGAACDATPVRTLDSALLVSEDPALAVDETGEIFTVGQSSDDYFDNDEISVFAAGAQGNATPTQVITDGVREPGDIAVSRSGNFLYVANTGDNTITVYHRAFGLFSLVETIPEPLDVNIRAWTWRSIAVDNAGLVYGVRQFADGTPNDVLVFHRTANGPFEQVRRFFGFVGDSNSIAVDAAGFAYVTETWADGHPDAVRVFGPNASGLSQIIASIVGAASELDGPVAAVILPRLGLDRKKDVVDRLNLVRLRSVAVDQGGEGAAACSAVKTVCPLSFEATHPRCE